MTEIYRDGKRVVSQFDDPTTLTRRDHFAMAALPAVIAATCSGQHDPRPVGSAMPLEEAMTIDCYRIADAMEAARNKEGGE